MINFLRVKEKLTKRNLLAMVSLCGGALLNWGLLLYVAPEFLYYWKFNPRNSSAGKGDPSTFLFIIPVLAFAYLVDFLVFRGRPLRHLVVSSLFPMGVWIACTVGGARLIQAGSLSPTIPYKLVPVLAFFVWLALEIWVAISAPKKP